jgi:predicted ATPase/class 3 adenylate cyclase
LSRFKQSILHPFAIDILKRPFSFSTVCNLDWSVKIAIGERNQMTKSIADWLDDVGLGKYAKEFESQDIGLDILDQLTECHLKEIGISLGDRLRLLNVINAKAAQENQAAPVAQPASITPIPSTENQVKAETPRSDAERRPLTVMFCDLANSTALSTQLDPEDLQDVIRAYQDASAECVRKYEGYVAKYMGDGILVYFGYPKSLERNGERAVRSALDIIEAMTGLNQTLGKDKDIEIAARVGIATGTVMVGEVVGEGMAQERTVIGEAPNMAARLQSLAGRNGIVVGSLTKEISGDVFLYEDMGIHKLKGIPEPVQTWSVTGLRDDNERSNADDHDAIIRPALVGRDEEIGLLSRAWQSTKGEARGQVVSLSGEAGIGKSSLIDGLKAQVQADGWPFLTMRCSPYHTNSALYPVVEHFKRLARWQPEDDEMTRLDKIERMLGRYAQPNSEAVPLMAAFLSVPVPEDRHPPLTVSPQQQKQLTQDMIVGITMEVVERGAFLHMWEDLHWADPSTLELISLLIEQAPTTGLLIMLTARPEFIPPWPMRSHIMPITLNRLERTHAAALVVRLAGEKPLPDEVVDYIVTKTDGVPLYVEELTKTILVSDILRDTGGRFELTGPLASLTIPDTLQESLMARLDRLPKVREVAQLGSVLGREFAYSMISGLSVLDDTMLQEGLGQLVENELLYQRGRPPLAKYIFKHALVQDAAYASLLRRTRQQFHLQAAELLEANFPDIVETSPEIVAQHYSEAGVPEQAVVYWQRAGQRSAERFAHSESISHFRHVLAQNSKLTDSPKRTRVALLAQIAIAGALSWTAGPGAAEVGEAYTQARNLADEIDDNRLRARVLMGSMAYFKMRGEWSQAEILAKKLLDNALQTQAPADLLPAYVSLGECYFWQGRMSEAMEYINQAMIFENQISEAVNTIHTSPWARIAAHSYSAWIVMMQGDGAETMVRHKKAISLSEELSHPFSRAFALHFAAHNSIMLRLPQDALKYSDAEVALATEQKFSAHVSGGKIYHGIAMDMAGTDDDPIEEIREGIVGWQQSGGETALSIYEANLASILAKHGHIEAAWKLILQARYRMEKSDERIYQSDILRRQGEIALGQNNEALKSKACEYFNEAIMIARKQNTRFFELRACVSLARLWQQQGKNSDARNLLTPVFDRFTEGYDTADLNDAKALLDKLV